MPAEAMHRSLHPTPYILHPTPYTLHPTPYTLHPSHYTLHATPYSRCEVGDMAAKAMNGKRSPAFGILQSLRAPKESVFVN